MREYFSRYFVVVAAPATQMASLVAMYGATLLNSAPGKEGLGGAVDTFGVALECLHDQFEAQLTAYELSDLKGDLEVKDAEQSIEYERLSAEVEAAKIRDEKLRENIEQLQVANEQLRQEAAARMENEAARLGEAVKAGKMEGMAAVESLRALGKELDAITDACATHEALLNKLEGELKALGNERAELEGLLKKQEEARLNDIRLRDSISENALREGLASAERRLEELKRVDQERQVLDELARDAPRQIDIERTQIDKARQEIEAARQAAQREAERLAVEREMRERARQAELAASRQQQLARGLQP